MTRHALVVPGLAALAGVALLILALSNGQLAARGWLCAFVLISMAPIGSLGLLLVYGITGGRWGEDLAPVLVSAARCIPLLLLGFLPVLIFRPLIYQWAQLGLPHGVRQDYLNPPFFDARTLIALAIWSALAWTDAWKNQLFAALGLFAFLILTTFIPPDWILTIQPGSVSAGFGLGFGIEQMFAALGLAAALAPQGSGRASRDLAGLTITTLLGSVYFLYVGFLIPWYGNIPDKVRWFVTRSAIGWAWVGLAAFLIGAALPFLAILNPCVRREPGALRIVGFLVLTGIALHVAWLTIPAFGATAIVPAVLATALMGLLGFTAASLSPVRERAHG